jgi:hypothetical protein
MKVEKATDEQLAQWASDSNCKEQARAASELRRRDDIAQEQLKRSQFVAAHPFDARREVSADAQHVVKHLWIIFVLLPALVWLLYKVAHPW